MRDDVGTAVVDRPEPTVGPSPAPVVLALNSSAIHLGSALGAMLGGASPWTWVRPIGCGG